MSKYCSNSVFHLKSKGGGPRIVKKYNLGLNPKLSF